MLSLSDHDKAVLNCVFNPHLPLEQAYEEEDIPELKGRCLLTCKSKIM